MRIVVHDFTAFSFPVQLSRELARRGHDVLHMYSDLDPRGGRLRGEPEDPATLAIEAVSIGESYAKYRVASRARQEWKYARRIAHRLEAFRPDVVFNANTAVSISHRILSWARRNDARYVHWTQDIYSLASRTVLSRRLGIAGWALSRVLQRMEAATIDRADAVIVISDDFADEFAQLGFTPKRIYTIPNWMPIDEMRPEPKVNPWSSRNGLAETMNLMYVGMLGFKHDTRLLVELARGFAHDPRVRVVVVGAGIVFDALADEKRAQGLDNLVMLGWQDYSDISYVLASADVLVALVSADASRYSVPSKILSYLSAQRPVLAAIPAGNLAHRLLVTQGAGLAVDPADIETLMASARRLVESEELRASLAAAGRAYATTNFDIDVIGRKFIQIIDDLAAG